MTGNDLFREIGNINEKYVTEAEETKRSVIMTPVFRRTLATAACLVVCFGLYFSVRQLGMGGQSETASMESSTSITAGQTDMSIKAESTVMDSATNSVTGAGEESMYEDAEDSAFWEDIWPTEGDTVADCAPADTEVKNESASVGESASEEKEVTKTDFVIVQESETVQDSILTFEVDLYYDACVWSEQKDVEAFLETTANGEEAVLELIQLFEDGTYARAALHYTRDDSYEWTEWHEPSYGNDQVEAPGKNVYGYLKVFEDIQEDGTTYCVVGLGETDDFTLYDLQNHTSGTVVVLKYEK